MIGDLSVYGSLTMKGSIIMDRVRWGAGGGGLGTGKGVGWVRKSD